MSLFSVAGFLVAVQLIAQYTVVMSVSVTMPEVCKGSHYCIHKGEDYPEELISKLNIKNQLPKMVMETSGTHDPGHRLGHNDGDATDITRDLCLHRKINATVYYILDTNNKTRVVVQLAHFFEQVFGLQECKYPGPIKKSTSQVNMSVIRRLNMTCENIYYHYEYYVLSDDGTGIEKALSAKGLPVYCACQYKTSKITERNLRHWNQRKVVCFE